MFDMMLHVASALFSRPVVPGGAGGAMAWQPQILADQLNFRYLNQEGQIMPTK